MKPGTELGLFGSCDKNVQNMIQKFGGKEVMGLIVLVTSCAVVGIYHVIWETKDAKLIDVTWNPFECVDIMFLRFGNDPVQQFTSEGKFPLDCLMFFD